VKIEVKRSDLLHALAAADGVARTNPTRPLLECVLITAIGKDSVTIAATDAAMTIRATLASSNGKPGSIAINAKRLREVVSHAPNDSMSLAELPNSFIEIKSGKASYRLASIPGRDFPKIPEPGDGVSVTIDGAALKQLISRTLFSTSDDKTRTNLCGAFFEISGGVASMTSADGHRLSRATCNCVAPDFSALIPSEALAKMARIADGDIELIVERARIFVRTDAITFCSPLIDGTAPPYDQVIPKAFQHVITVDRARLIASIERTRVTASETRGMAIDGIDGGLRLSTSHPDVGEVSDEIEVEGADKSKDLASCVAPKYLIEPLGHFDDDAVKIKLGAELDPVVIQGAEGDGYTVVVMPMRR
jgi:DNA polymerase-3 subunit beta